MSMILGRALMMLAFARVVTAAHITGSENSERRDERKDRMDYGIVRMVVIQPLFLSSCTIRVSTTLSSRALADDDSKRAAEK